MLHRAGAACCRIGVATPPGAAVVVVRALRGLRGGAGAGVHQQHHILPRDDVDSHAYTQPQWVRRARAAHTHATPEPTPEGGGPTATYNTWSISTPHPGSRLRKSDPPRVKPHQTESEVELELREQLDADFEWHHEFWSVHNQKFAKARAEFTAKYKEERDLGPSDRVPADDMSVFYQDFIMSTASQHREYARLWRRRNFQLVWLRIRCAITRARR
eukprot:m.32900 g.32900  ORF g.32900 m.32900 type:complete len:216 (-) comp12483_c0_seq1:349-996(-)